MMTPSIETGIGISAESMKASPPTPQTPSGFITASRVVETLCKSAIGPMITNLYSTACVGKSASMSGITGQQVERMRQQRKHRPQRTLGTGRTSGKIDHQALPQNATDSAPQRRKRRVSRAVLANQLRQPRN